MGYGRYIGGGGERRHTPATPRGGTSPLTDSQAAATVRGPSGDESLTEHRQPNSYGRHKTELAVRAIPRVTIGCNPTWLHDPVTNY